MFTGIIENIGLMKNLIKKKDIHQLSIYIEKNLESPKLGDSISVNGVCLTIADIKKKLLIFDVMKETFMNTTLRYLKHNEAVNIEQALKTHSRLEGHFVLGHVDCSRKIKYINKGINPYIDLSLFPDDKKYIAARGSVAIDGISLTVATLYHDRFRVYLIPYTLQNTNLKYKKAGDRVNIEFDILARYIQEKNKSFI